MRYFKSILFAIIMFSTVGIFSACKKQEALIDTKNLDEVDAIEITLAMGNPIFGTNRKLVTDPSEINCFVETFSSAVLGGQTEDYADSFPSTYVFMYHNKAVAEFFFNGNNDKIISVEGEYRNVSYPQGLKSPFELYSESQAEAYVVDASGNELPKE